MSTHLSTEPFYSILQTKFFDTVLRLDLTSLYECFVIDMQLKNLSKTTFFTRVMSKIVLDLRQYSLSIWLTHINRSHLRRKLLVVARAWQVCFSKDKKTEIQQTQKHEIATDEK